MTNYSRGAKFEYRVRAWYERKGYTVIRAAGSHGAADLIAWYAKYGSVPDVVVIQCKCGKKKSYVKAIDELNAMRIPENWRRELWISEGKKTFVRDLADITDQEVKING